MGKSSGWGIRPGPVGPRERERERHGTYPIVKGVQNSTVGIAELVSIASQSVSHTGE